VSKRLLVLLILVLVVSVAFPAAAITYGEEDVNNDYPGVVLIIMDIDGFPAYRCSGTMLTPDFVLTAGHCTGAPGEFSGMRIFTEQDVENGDNSYPFPGNNTIEAEAWASHPDYPFAPFFYNDVGMIKLSEPYDSGHYGTLPEVNSLDDLQRGKKTEFTSVGYGLQRINPVFIESEKVRMIANPHLIQINTPGFTGDFSMLLSNNASTGGTCFGDSGGPNFLGDTTIVAGVTSFGINGNCAGTGGVFRMDQPDVLDFVYDFMANS
jgi:V8-like Glu-specific endopeptidase